MRARPGFTLLEVLIAIALTLALCAAMFVFLHDMLATRSRTLDYAQRQRAAATLIERLEADVASCLVGDSHSGSGLAGDATHLKLLTRGVMTQQAERGLEEPAVLGDLQSVEYQFTGRNIDARKGMAGEAGEFVTLGGAVAHVRFRYLVGRQWQATFDSLEARRLPDAIEVCVWFDPWPSVLSGNASGAEGGGGGEGATSAPAGDDQPSGNFDENAFAAKSESDSFRSPPPDRRCVIVIPDAGAEEDSTDAGA